MLINKDRLLETNPISSNLKNIINFMNVNYLLPTIFVKYVFGIIHWLWDRLKT